MGSPFGASYPCRAHRTPILPLAKGRLNGDGAYGSHGMLTVPRAGVGHPVRCLGHALGVVHTHIEPHDVPVGVEFEAR